MDKLDNITRSQNFEKRSDDRIGKVPCQGRNSFQPPPEERGALSVAFAVPQSAIPAYPPPTLPTGGKLSPLRGTLFLRTDSDEEGL